MKIKQKIIADLIYKAETGGLDRLSQNEISEILNGYLRRRYANKDEAKRGVKQTLDSLHSFLNRLTNYFSMSEKELKAKYDLFHKLEQKEASLPKGCYITDADEVIEFAKKLDKEKYNYSDVGRLLNRQRQTIKNWVDENNYGLVADTQGDDKRATITRENLLKFYRTWKGQDWNF